MKFKGKKSAKHIDSSNNFVHSNKKGLIRKIGSFIYSLYLLLLLFIVYFIDYVFIRFLWEFVIRNIFLFIKRNFKNICILIMTLVMICCLFIIKDISESINDILSTRSSIENLSDKIESQSNIIKDNNKSTEERINSLEKKVEDTSKKITSRGGATVRKESNKNTQTTSSNESWKTFNVSAYCGCSKCCGKSNLITASGAKATQGVTIAASSNYVFGTKIYLEGLGTYTVQDRGGAIKGNKIDVYFNSHSQALEFGRKNIRGRVIQ